MSDGCEILRERVQECAATIATQAAQIEAMHNAFNSAPVLSFYHGQKGFELEAFVQDYAKWKRETHAALAAGGNK